MISVTPEKRKTETAPQGEGIYNSLDIMQTGRPFAQDLGLTLFPGSQAQTGDETSSAKTLTALLGDKNIAKDTQHDINAYDKSINRSGNNVINTWQKCTENQKIREDAAADVNEALSSPYPGVLSPKKLSVGVYNTAGYGSYPTDSNLEGSTVPPNDHKGSRVKPKSNFPSCGKHRRADAEFSKADDDRTRAHMSKKRRLEMYDGAKQDLRLFDNASLENRLSILKATIESFESQAPCNFWDVTGAPNPARSPSTIRKRTTSDHTKEPRSPQLTIGIVQLGEYSDLPNFHLRPNITPSKYVARSHAYHKINHTTIEQHSRQIRATSEPALPSSRCRVPVAFAKSETRYSPCLIKTALMDRSTEHEDGLRPENSLRAVSDGDYGLSDITSQTLSLPSSYQAPQAQVEHDDEAARSARLANVQISYLVTSNATLRDTNARLLLALACCDRDYTRVATEYDKMEKQLEGEKKATDAAVKTYRHALRHIRAECVAMLHRQLLNGQENEAHLANLRQEYEQLHAQYIELQNQMKEYKNAFAALRSWQAKYENLLNFVHENFDKQLPSILPRSASQVIEGRLNRSHGLDKVATVDLTEGDQAPVTFQGTQTAVTSSASNDLTDSSSRAQALNVLAPARAAQVASTSTVPNWNKSALYGSNPQINRLAMPPLPNKQPILNAVFPHPPVPIKIAIPLSLCLDAMINRHDHTKQPIPGTVYVTVTSADLEAAREQQVNYHQEEEADSAVKEVSALPAALDGIQRLRKSDTGAKATGNEDAREKAEIEALAQEYEDTLLRDEEQMQNE